MKASLCDTFARAVAPEDGRCMCLLEASKSDDVKRLNDEGRPNKRIVPTKDLTVE